MDVGSLEVVRMYAGGRGAAGAGAGQPPLTVEIRGMTGAGTQSVTEIASMLTQASEHGKLEEMLGRRGATYVIRFEAPPSIVWGGGNTSGPGPQALDTD